MDISVTEVWQRVHEALRAFIAKRVADEAEVDDILQEVCLRMHQRIDGLKDPGRVVSWVYQITRRCDHRPLSGTGSPPDTTCRVGRGD